MVSHDFGRRTIRGLPPGASAALRGGGSLEAEGVHRSIADVWRSVLAPPVHTPLPAMSAAEVRQHFGRGVLSDARPADGALFGGAIEWELGGPAPATLGGSQTTAERELVAVANDEAYSGDVAAGCACMVDAEFLKMLAAAEGGCKGGISYAVEAAGEGCQRFIVCRGERYSAGARDSRCEPPMVAEFTWEAGAVASTLASARASRNKCRIEVGARTFERVSKFGYLFHHLFVIVTDEDERRWAIHGGPGGQRQIGCALGDMGCIRVRYPLNEDGVTENESDFPLELIADGPVACDAVPCMERVAADINAAGILYEPLGPNSNSVANSVIRSCGMTLRVPPGARTPGWTTVIP